MRCDEAGRLISAGLDGELEGNCASQLRAHLADCALCLAEREALAATVRLLRAVPEVEPPAELRGRIGGALFEMERRADRPSLELGWLVRSRGSGWAWGAAAGVAAGAALLVLTRAPAPEPRLATVPRPAPSRAASLPLSSAAPGESRLARKLHATVGKKASAGQPAQMALRHLTVELPPAAPPSVLVPPELPTPAPSSPVQPPRKIHPHMIHRLTPVTQRFGPALAALPPSTHPTSPHPVSSDPEAATGDNSSRPARPKPLTSPDNMASSPSDPDASTDAPEMTQMASGTMPPASAPDDDDLAELRRRLQDRPLQVPELGTQKPAESRHSSRDGWIRF